MTAWLKYSEMTWLRLLEGPSDRVIVPVAPTMKRVTYKGERYNRMESTRSTKRGRPGEQGGAYLWDGWREQKLAEIRAAKTQEVA